MKRQSLIDPFVHANAPQEKRKEKKPLPRGSSQNTSMLVKIFAANYTQPLQTFEFGCVMLWLSFVRMFRYLCSKQMEIPIKKKKGEAGSQWLKQEFICQKPIKTLSSDGSQMGRKVRWIQITGSTLKRVPRWMLSNLTGLYNVFVCFLVISRLMGLDKMLFCFALYRKQN